MSQELDRKHLAKQRNWNKMRLMGFTLNYDVLSENEKKIYNEIFELITTLRINWERESSDLGLYIKPYQCTSCSRRSTVEHILEGKNYCFRCYKDIIEYDNR